MLSSEDDDWGRQLPRLEKGIGEKDLTIQKKKEKKEEGKIEREADAVSNRRPRRRQGSSREVGGMRT